MFSEQIGTQILEISHKRIESPSQSVYFNHIHNYGEILLFITGQANYNIDGQIFTPKPYDIFFVPAATYHYLIPTASVPHENYVIGIAPTFIDAEKYEKLFRTPMMFSLKDDLELYSYFKRLDSYYEQYSIDDFLCCAQCLVRELVTYCYYHKNALTSVCSTNLTHINNMITYIHEHLDQELDADKIAQHLMMSKSYVQNLFSQNMHIGLKKYIMQKKIHAAHMDISQGLTPSAVCDKYAFGDYSSFYRLYRKTFGVSPKKQWPTTSDIG
ncbi:MAG: helix-turn-helix transcriptional regulator [Clostridia bacterium]|nr:helix-turn-helix transcriptional regulator [Clostridia bacterium]